MLCATGDSVSCFLVLLFFYANMIQASAQQARSCPLHAFPNLKKIMFEMEREKII